jgi:magnesium chelatase family protein
MAIVLLLAEANLHKIWGYIIPSSIDIHCEIQAVPFAELSQMQPGEPSATIRERVIRARNIQMERFSSLPLGEGGGRGRPHCNAQMTERMLHEFAEAIGYRRSPLVALS